MRFLAEHSSFFSQPLTSLHSDQHGFLASIDPALVSAAFVGLAGLLGVIIGVVLVQKRFNRTYILYFSAFGTSMAFLGLGIKGLVPNDDDGIPWVETLCLVLHVSIFNMGFGCLGFPMMAELLPPKIRTTCLAFIMVLGGLFGFANSMSFVQLKNFISQEEIFFTYSAINMLGLIYLYLFFPNVENRTAANWRAFTQKQTVLKEPIKENIHVNLLIKETRPGAKPPEARESTVEYCEWILGVNELMKTSWWRAKWVRFVWWSLHDIYSFSPLKPQQARQWTLISNELESTAITDKEYHTTYALVVRPLGCPLSRKKEQEGKDFYAIFYDALCLNSTKAQEMKNRRHT